MRKTGSVYAQERERLCAVSLIWRERLCAKLEGVFPYFVLLGLNDSA